MRSSLRLGTISMTKMNHSSLSNHLSVSLSFHHITHTTTRLKLDLQTLRGAPCEHISSKVSTGWYPSITMD